MTTPIIKLGQFNRDIINKSLSFIKKGCILGIDFGDKNVGLSISDINRKIAFPLKVFSRNEVIKEIKKIIEQEEITAIVIGWPVQMNGIEGKQCEKVKKFINDLNVSVTIFVWDERLSTIAVERVLLTADISRKKRAKVIDKTAATYILQGALDCLNANF